MKSRSHLLLAALALVGAAGLSLRLLRPAPSTPTSANSGSGVRPGLEEHPGKSYFGSLPTGGEARPGEAGGAVATRLRRAQVVARVNDVPIIGATMLAFHDRDGDAVPIAPATYDMLRRQAIERELIGQAARANGVELSPAQRKQLEQVRAQAQARGESDPAQLDFEENAARAQLLLNSLAEKNGAPAEFAGPADVDRYYKEHSAELGALPSDATARAAAMQSIQIKIRQRLYDEMQAARQRWIRQYLDGLRAAARVTD